MMMMCCLKVESGTQEETSVRAFDQQRLVVKNTAIELVVPSPLGRWAGMNQRRFPSSSRLRGSGESHDRRSIDLP